MRFDFDDEQREIKDTARQFLSARFKPEKVRELAEAGTYDDALWTEVCRARLARDRDRRGARRPGPRDGRADDPLRGARLRLRAASLPLERRRRAGDRGRRLRRAEGELAARASPRARRAGRSAAPSVLIDGEGAACAVVYACSTTRWRRRSSTSTASHLEPLDLIDATRRYSKLGRRRRRGARRATSRRQRDRMLVAVAADLVGVAQRAMEMAVEYAKERKQFDRPIGAYQAVSHLCAEMLYDVEEARSLTYFAAWAADAEPDSLPLAAAMAKARASDAAWERLQGVDPGPRRNRLHLGARPALPAQAGPRRRPAVRHRRPAPRARRRARRPGIEA